MCSTAVATRIQCDKQIDKSEKSLNLFKWDISCCIEMLQKPNSVRNQTWNCLDMLPRNAKNSNDLSDMSSMRDHITTWQHVSVNRINCLLFAIMSSAQDCVPLWCSPSLVVGHRWIQFLVVDIHPGIWPPVALTLRARQEWKFKPSQSCINFVSIQSSKSENSLTILF